MGVPATGHVFHESHVAGSKHSPGAITGANLDFAGQMNDQPAFGKRVEVPLSGTVKLLHPDLVYIGQCAHFRVLLQTQFLHMAFTVTPRKNSIYSHSAPPHSIARLLNSGLRLVRQTISSAQNSLACHNEGIVASGRRIVHRYSSGKSRAASGRGSAARVALGFDVEGVDGLAGGYEQAVPFAAAEAEVGTAFRQQNAPEQGGVWRKDRDAILPWTAGEATPDIPLGIATDAVRISWHGVEKQLTVHGLAVHNIIDMRGLRAARRIDHACL